MGRWSRKARRGKDARDDSGNGRLGRSVRSGLDTLPVDPVLWEGGVFELTPPVVEALVQDLESSGDVDAEREDAERVAADLVSVLWADVETGEVVRSDVVTRKELPEAAVTVLFHAMWAPDSGLPRRPGRVAVSDVRLASHLRTALRGTGTEVILKEDLERLPRVAGDLTEGLEEMGRFVLFGYLQGDGVTEPLVRRFFQSAAAFHRARPWLVFGDDPLLEFGRGWEEGWIVVIPGEGQNDGGMAVFPSEEELFHFVDLMRRGGGLAPGEPDPFSTTLTFQPESDISDLMREERRRHRWALASPSAFPVLALKGERPTRWPPDAQELLDLCLAMEAVVELVKAHGPALRRGESAQWAGRLADASGAQLVVRAARRALESLEKELLDSLGLESAEGVLKALRGLIDEDPSSPRIVQRLAWTFYFAALPLHVDEEGDRLGALMRFRDWAHFLAPVPDSTEAADENGGRRTLAERALAAMADDMLPRPVRERMEALARADHSIFTVLRVKRGRLTLLNERSGETFDIESEGLEEGVRVGEAIVGAIFCAGDERLLSQGVLHLASTADREERREFARKPPDLLARTFERVGCGASPEWIGDLPDRESVAEAYRRFRADTTDTLPTFEALEEMTSEVRRGESPEVSGLDLWSEEELAVFATFARRISKL